MFGISINAVAQFQSPVYPRPAANVFRPSSLYAMHSTAYYLASLMQTYRSLMQGFASFAGGQAAPHRPTAKSAPKPTPKPVAKPAPRPAKPQPKLPKGFKKDNSPLFSGTPQQQVDQARKLLRQFGPGQHGNIMIHQQGFGGRFVVALSGNHQKSTSIQFGLNESFPSLITQFEGTTPTFFEVKTDSARPLTFEEFRSFR